MKKTVSASLGGRNFIFDEDAYERIQLFFDIYEKNLRDSKMETPVEEIISEQETRMAGLFEEALKGREVVDLAMATETITRMGFVAPISDAGYSATTPHKKLYRDMDHRVLGGVCSGISHYTDLDPVIIKVLFVLGFIFGLAGLWVYVVFWIIVPAATTPIEKCEMFGLPATAENLGKFSK